LYMFVISVVFSALYLVAYPGLGSFPGVLGWTQVGAWEKEMQRADARFAPLFNRHLELPVETVARDPQALKMGQRLFANSCAQCHGSDARGSFGFPNLTDGTWLYGGSPEAIRHSITEGRRGQMPAWGPMLGDDTVRALTDHVLA